MTDLIEVCKKNLDIIENRIKDNKKYFARGPEVNLYWTSPKPFEMTAVTARSCYLTKPAYPEDVDNPKSGEKREIWDRLVPSLYYSGHKTPLGHASAHLVITASRASIWSFLHAYPFYSSSNQQSQRYAEMFKNVKEDALVDASEPQIIDLDYAIIPNLKDPQSEKVYRETFSMQFRAYRKLTELISDDASKDYYSRFPKQHGTKEGERALKRRCLEISRYVLPLGTMAHLWYTISLLSAYRLDRYSDSNTPKEAQIIADLILQKWATQSPENLKLLAEKPITIPFEETLEGKLVNNIPDIEKNRAYVREFDSKLCGLKSRIINQTIDASYTLASAVRAVLGKTESELPNEDAVELALNPAKNPSLIHPLDDKLRSPVSMCLNNIYFTFRKKISHTCDSQNQRHRTIQGGRPLLITQYTSNPEDCIIPDLIANNPAAKELYQETLDKTFKAINSLLEREESWEHVLYLLPNAIPIRFVETGSLLYLHSKFRERLCWNAQKEIWDVSLQELDQIKKIYPNIGKWLGAPCHIVDWGKTEAELEGTKIPLSIGSCPESQDRFCGVKAWEILIREWSRVI